MSDDTKFSESEEPTLHTGGSRDRYAGGASRRPTADRRDQRDHRNRDRGSFGASSGRFGGSGMRSSGGMGMGGGPRGSGGGSGGRTRQVVVERKVRRTFSGDEVDGLDAEIHSLESTIMGSPPNVSSRLTHNERQARLEALELHKEETLRRQKTQEETLRQRRDAQEAQELYEKNLAQSRAPEPDFVPEENAQQSVASSPAITHPATSAAFVAEAPSPRRAPVFARPASDVSASSRKFKKREGSTGGGEESHAKRDTGQRRQYARVHIERMLMGDDDRQKHSLASGRRRIEREKKKHVGEEMVRVKTVREVNIPDSITIQELANRMSERAVDVIRTLLNQGVIVKITDTIDADTAQLIAEEFGHTVKRVAENLVEEGLIDQDDPEDTKEPRPPIVTVMGHVDHGKTSLLDALRQTDVISGEAGGITQHIGAYQVTLDQGRKITFLDTPGHEAFTAMRARGAKITDIVVLVVAADDGVMPQTIEAIQHAKAAGVPILVAINKMDKPEANIDSIKKDLLQYELVAEDYGGDTIMVPISAKKKTGLRELEEMILLQADVLNLRANPNRTAEGIIIESHLDKGFGPIGTVLVQRGTIRIGDIVLCGTSFGRIRALLTDKGENVKEAGPSTPVALVGLSSAPDVGDVMVVVETEARAREVVDYRMQLKANKHGSNRISLDQAMLSAGGAGPKVLPVIIKADVRGSAEAITQALEKIGNGEVSVRVVYTGVGAVSDSDIHLAVASKAPIIGFNVRAQTKTRDLARQHNVDMRFYSIIYNLINDIKVILSGLLAPKVTEIPVGMAEILDVFVISRVGKVAGCIVREGSITRQSHIRVVRDGTVVYQGKVGSLKRFKEDVKAVREGQECGISIENYQNVAKGDILECFQIEEKREMIL